MYMTRAARKSPKNKNLGFFLRFFCIQINILTKGKIISILPASDQKRTDLTVLTMYRTWCWDENQQYAAYFYEGKCDKSIEFAFIGILRRREANTYILLGSMFSAAA